MLACADRMHSSQGRPRCPLASLPCLLAGAPQGRLSVEPGAYPAVRRDESVVEVLHGDTIHGARRGWPA